MPAYIYVAHTQAYTLRAFLAESTHARAVIGEGGREQKIFRSKKTFQWRGGSINAEKMMYMPSEDEQEDTMMKFFEGKNPYTLGRPHAGAGCLSQTHTFTRLVCEHISMDGVYNLLFHSCFSLFPTLQNLLSMTHSLYYIYSSLLTLSLSL